jgi:hypothetical protein
MPSSAVQHFKQTHLWVKLLTCGWAADAPSATETADFKRPFRLRSFPSSGGMGRYNPGDSCSSPSPLNGPGGWPSWGLPPWTTSCCNCCCTHLAAPVSKASLPPLQAASSCCLLKTPTVAATDSDDCSCCNLPAPGSGGAASFPAMPLALVPPPAKECAEPAGCVPSPLLSQPILASEARPSKKTA